MIKYFLLGFLLCVSIFSMMNYIYYDIFISSAFIYIVIGLLITFLDTNINWQKSLMFWVGSMLPIISLWALEKFNSKATLPVIIMIGISFIPLIISTIASLIRKK